MYVYAICLSELYGEKVLSSTLVNPLDILPQLYVSFATVLRVRTYSVHVLERGACLLYTDTHDRNTDLRT
jgi:hypothetical protein